MKTLPTRKIVVLLTIGFGLLALAALSNWHTSGQVQRNHAAVATSHQVRGSLTRLLAAVQDVQMGQRGYLIAADQQFLVPYTFGVQQTEFHFNRLLRLTADNSRHQQRLNALKPLLDQKLAHSRDTIALRDKQGFEAAQREVASGRGQAMTDTIRLALQDIDQDEGAVLVKRLQAAAKASDINTFAVVTGFGLSFVLLGVAFFLLLRANSRHRAADNDGRAKTAMLHSVLHTVGDAIAVTDASGNFFVSNPAAEKFFGIVPSASPKAPGASPVGASAEAPAMKTQWLRPEQRTPFPADQLPIPSALRGETVTNLDILIRNSAYPTGVVVTINARPLLTESGTIIGVVLLAKEVPHRKPAEARPAKPDEQTPRNIQETAPKQTLPVLPNPVLATTAQPKPVVQPTPQPKPVVQAATRPTVQAAPASATPKAPGASAVCASPEGPSAEAPVKNRVNDPAQPKPLVQPANKPQPTPASATPKAPGTSPVCASPEGRPPTGTTTFQRRAPSLNDVIDQTVATLRPAATLQQITLSQQLATNLPDIPFDAAGITEILNNLLTNALKHTPFGGTILVTSRQPSPDLVHISVTDNGSGIPADRCQRIFDRDQTSTAANGGLFTCRERLQTYGGKIWVESETAKGSTFTFTLPTAAVPAILPTPAAVATPAKPEPTTTDLSSAELDEIMQSMPWNKNKAA